MSAVAPPVAYVAVIGPSDAAAPVLSAARSVGALLAAAGAVVVCGGGGGAMEAACRGAVERGGVAVGFLPGTSRAEANPYVTIALPTGLGEVRNALIVRSADAVIAVGGGVGTLSEIGLALRMGKPVVGLGTWQVSAPSTDPAGGVPAGVPAGLVTTGTPEEAVALALALAQVGVPGQAPA